MDQRVPGYGVGRSIYGVLAHDSEPLVSDCPAVRMIVACYCAAGAGHCIRYVEGSVSFTVLPGTGGIQLISEVPKQTLLMGERMPLFSRVVKVDEDGELEPIVIESDVDWKITTIEGSGTVAEAEHWRDVWHESLPEEPGHTEWWYTGTLAGLSEGKVKVQAFITYFTRGYPLPQLNMLAGPEHEVKVRGFVDVRLDAVGEWGEEEPGAFMEKGAVEQLKLRTCTAGDVVLAWSSDKVGLYTDIDCEDKVVEEEGSLKGSRRASFLQEFMLWTERDSWGAQFSVEELWAKALEASDARRDINLSLAPLSGKAVSDVLNLTSCAVSLKEVTFSGEKFHDVAKDDGTGNYEVPHWQDNSEPLDGDAEDETDHKYPACFTRNTKMKVTAKVKLMAPVSLRNGSMMMRADGPSDGLLGRDLDIPATTATIADDELAVTQVECSAAFKDEIDAFDPLKLDWKVSADGGASWFPVGESENQVYITRVDPQSPLYHTVAHISCTNGEGETEVDPARTKIYGEFTDRVVNRVAVKGEEETQLTYWGEGQRGGTDAGGLLKEGNGDCGGWVDLLMHCLEAHGVECGRIQVREEHQNPYQYAFLVKEYTFMGTGVYPDGAPYKYILGTDCNDAAGMAAQGNGDPDSVFASHFLVLSGEKYYDPSYGKGPFATQNEWEDASIDGFVNNVEILVEGEWIPVTLAKKNELGHEETVFIPW